MIIMIIIKRLCNCFTNAYTSFTYHAMYVNMFVFICALFCMWSCVDIGKTCSHWMSNKMFEFDVFFDLRLNKRLSKHSWGWWFETPSRSLWRHRNENGGHFVQGEMHHSRGAYSSVRNYCTLFNNPNSHRTVKHRQRCCLKRVIKLISHMLF